MKTKLFTNKELFDIGFCLIDESEFDDGSATYEVFGIKKNDCILEIIVEYHDDGTINQYAELNGEELKGRQLTREDILLLKEIM